MFHVHDVTSSNTTRCSACIHRPAQSWCRLLCQQEPSQLLGMPKVPASFLGRNKLNGFHYFPQTLQKMMTQYNTRHDHFLPYSSLSHWDILRSQQQANRSVSNVSQPCLKPKFAHPAIKFVMRHTRFITVSTTACHLSPINQITPSNSFFKIHFNIILPLTHRASYGLCRLLW